MVLQTFVENIVILNELLFARFGSASVCGSNGENSEFESGKRVQIGLVSDT
jgi:hypothetical protein